MILASRLNEFILGVPSALRAAVAALWARYSLGTGASGTVTPGFARARRAAHAGMALLAVCTLTAQASRAQTNKPSGTLITNVTVHVGDGQVLPNAAIGIDAQGLIAFVAPMTDPRVNPKLFAEMVSGLGQHAYPGFIAPDTRLGLVEIEAVRATLDYDEVGAYNPNVRAVIAYNTDSDIIPTLRSNGVLLAQVCTDGGVISGKSALVGLQSGPLNWEDVSYRDELGIHLHWPRRFQTSGWWAEPGSTSKSDKYFESVAPIKQYFKEARAYTQEAKPKPINLAFEAMRPVFAREQKVFVHVDDAQSIMEVVQFAEAEKINLVLVGAREAWQVAEFLALHQVPVIYTTVQSLPSREDEDYDQPYKTPAILASKGVLFCLGLDGSWQQRNLVFHAGQAVAFGLDPEQAVAAISLNTARILGVDKTTGSLEAGKEATLILSQGNVLDMRSSIVTKAYIKGQEQNLGDKQKTLYNTYLEKFKSN